MFVYLPIILPVMYIKNVQNLHWKIWVSLMEIYIPYSCKQKHVLLFRNSEILLKSQLLTCCIFFLRSKTFLFLNFQHLIDFWFHESSQNFNSFGQLLFFGAHVTNWIWIQLVTRGVTNRDVLLLATIRNQICI